MSLSPVDLEYIRKAVYDRSGVSLGVGDDYLIESRLDVLVREKGLRSLEELARQLRLQTANLLDEVVDAMTTNETLFFRDEATFDALRSIIIPELLERLPRGVPLRIWCAASSSGQEPISLAILMREHFPQFPSGRVQIIGTDISQSMINRCEQAEYSDLEVSRGLSQTLLERYFHRVGSKWRVNDEVRRMTSFRTLNLAQPFPHLHKMHLVLCRYVLIYFDKPTKLSILHKISRVMGNETALMLGAETVNSPDLAARKCGNSYYYVRK